MDGSNRKVLHQNQREPVGMSDFILSEKASLLLYVKILSPIPSQFLHSQGFKVHE